MENLIKSDCCIVICKFLDPPDILNLYKLYPSIIPKTINTYKNQIKKDIDNFFKYSFGDKYEEFKNLMIECNAILSGSFILQVAYGQKWPGHRNSKLDIDIFIGVIPIYEKPVFRGRRLLNLDKEHTFYNHDNKFKLKYTKLHWFLYNFSKDKDCYVSESQYKDEMGQNVILRVNEYSIRKNIFQLIEINNEKFNSYVEFVNNCVDFDICKNYFSYVNGGELYIKNMDNVINKKTEFNYTNSEKDSKQRCGKYINRGINFTNVILNSNTGGIVRTF